MGSWGYSITENDTALDVYDEYLDHHNAKLAAKKIEAAIRKSFSEALEDDDDAVNVELGLAKAQWDCGHVTPATIKRIEKLIGSDAGMALWEEAGAEAAEKRRKVLSTFLAKLKTTNPRPKKPRKASAREPVFKPGDCLAFYDENAGKYAAALVLLSPIESPKPGQDTYGVNCLGILDYFEAKVPDRKVFEERQWLYIQSPFVRCKDDWVIAVDHPNALLWKIVNDKKRAVKFEKRLPQVTVVDRIKLTPDDAREQSFTMQWEIGEEFHRAFDAYAAAKKTGKIRRHGSIEKLLENYPDLRDTLRRCGSRQIKSKFDLSPLKSL